MKERPILFSAPMVVAILEGRKTQTRRLIKKHPSLDHEGFRCVKEDNFYRFEKPEHEFVSRSFECEYGKPGDRLWVRETFKEIVLTGHDTRGREMDGESYVYAADADAPTKKYMPWKPSIHMPRAASRITLEIVDVRVERLQEITEEDAAAEGAKQVVGDYGRGPLSYRTGFAEIWSGIHECYGPNGWNVSPWVWVITFRRINEAR